MSAQRRQAIMLVVLLAALVFVAWRQLGPSLGGAGGGLQGRRDAAGSAAGLAAAGDEVAELRLADLEHKPASYKPGRDPFRFAPRRRREPPPPPPPQPDPDAARRAAEAPRQRQQQAAPTPARPQPPPVNLVYLGSFGIPGRQIAVFSDGAEIHNAFQGDVVQTEFVVRRIGFESADIGFVNFPEAPPKRLAIGG